MSQRQFGIGSTLVVTEQQKVNRWVCTDIGLDHCTFNNEQGRKRQLSLAFVESLLEDSNGEGQ